MTARRRAQQNTGMMMREVNRVAIEHMGTDSWLESIDHSALAGVYATLSEMLEPCESFRDLLLHVDRLLRKTFSCERMRVMVCDEAGACLKHYSRGDYVNAVPMATGGIAAICATRRVLMRTNNAQNDDFFDPDEDTLFEDLDAGPIKNMLSAPGNFQESSVVVVQLVNKLELFGCAEAAGFSLHDCELFAFLTRHLAQHFVATEYYAALIRAEASTRQLIGIASSIVERSITRSLTDVMFEVQTKAAELLQCDRCVLLLVQSGGGSLFGVSADAARARTKKYNQQQHMMMAQQQQQQQHQQSQDDSTTAAGGGGGGGGGGVGVDGDGPSPPPAPAAKGIVKEDELEFRSASEGVVGAAVAKGRTINVDVARDHEDYIAELDASYIGEKCAAMIMPLQSSRGRDIVIGALAFSGPKRPGQTRFLVQDVRLGEDFATFCSIAIEQCYEVQRLHVSQEGMMQAFPSVSMRRVVIKAGWQTVRNLVAEFRKRKLRNAA